MPRGARLQPERQRQMSAFQHTGSQYERVKWTAITVVTGPGSPSYSIRRRTSGGDEDESYGTVTKKAVERWFASGYWESPQQPSTLRLWLVFSISP
ncbi:unnamed protein product [Lota lota]